MIMIEVMEDYINWSFVLFFTHSYVFRRLEYVLFDTLVVLLHTFFWSLNATFIALKRHPFKCFKISPFVFNGKKKNFIQHLNYDVITWFTKWLQNCHFWENFFFCPTLLLCYGHEWCVLLSRGVLLPLWNINTVIIDT